MSIKLLICLFILGLPQQLTFAQIKHDAFTKLLQKHVSTDGKVNYKGFIKDSIQLKLYLKQLSKNPPTNQWTKQEQMAFWINAYNAFTIDLVIQHYPIKSIKDIGSSIQIPFVNTPWDIKFIRIGKEQLDLNNIEHSKLRKQFGDARLHMVLVCASKSCPSLAREAYEANTLEQQLNDASKKFLTDKTKNQIQTQQSKLSMIFRWYAMDFNKNGKKVLDFVNQHQSTPISNKTKIEYLDYDWNLNE
ncbi:MAG: DUF547 domain-containing protein [Cyclobacteriaceae bacterium]|nr:DUF547 domain-containing protein [Cyclobacteriaceae bacterium]